MSSLRGAKSPTSTERALLVQVSHGSRDKAEAVESLSELASLADTAGAVVVGSITQRRDRHTPAFCVGEGKLAEIQLACRQAKAGLVIFDNELTPVQVNNLDLALGIKVIDRTEVILQIFARRARSAEAQIQVELAQLQYLIQRIPASSRQHRFTGGIGMKGPGESPFQLRNTPMRKRISELKSKLDTIQARREQTLVRKTWPIVCIVGYTNVGKSTLLNAFTAARAYVDDRLFATLDTKTRRVRIAEGRDVLLTDTVGFIRSLPHGLVASFRSTLSVVAQADLLLNVADAGHQRLDDHLDVVSKTLVEIGAGKVPSLLIFNKCDKPASVAALPELRLKYPDALCISAKNNEGLDELKRAIDHAIPRSHTYRQPGGYDPAGNPDPA
jgi:GTP-binding protein HflX